MIGSNQQPLEQAFLRRLNSLNIFGEDAHLIVNYVSSDLTDQLGVAVSSPIDGKLLATVDAHKHTITNHITMAEKSFEQWRSVPAPKRGELIRLYGEKLREVKKPLAKLITAEMGKPIRESEGEVQEMIDICDFAVGLSRQLYGLNIASERKNHKLLESWHPLGPVAVISAFNFPAAVFAWNFALAIVCGNSVIWKPSEKTPLTAIMCTNLFKGVARSYGAKMEPGKHSLYLTDLLQLVNGHRTPGEELAKSDRIKLVSATGSTNMGRKVGTVVQSRFGKSLLELGGNNAMIVTPSANRKQALTAAVFSAVGTAGQRCTTLRRLFVHKDSYNDFKEQLKNAYENMVHRIGNPLAPETIIGPLVDGDAVQSMHEALNQAKQEGGTVLFGGKQIGAKEGFFPGGHYVCPAIVEMPLQTPIVKQETFAPILYLMKYSALDEALALNNGVDQGLSSSIFTQNLVESERFLSVIGSDCGIANVNIGTSGAEIGGAFGGEKHTGGGRESGSDSWKNYMRRQTATINYGNPNDAVELAQGIEFKL